LDSVLVFSWYRGCVLSEAMHKSNGLSRLLILVGASTITLMVLALAVTDAFAGHAFAAESQVDWRARLARVELGDAPVVEQCLDLARPLAAQGRDERAEQRVRAFAERWGARKFEVERPSGRGKGEGVQ
jgi:hypothetical protein